MTELLILIAVVIATCVYLNNATFRIGVPVLLAFILLGMVFSNHGIAPAVDVGDSGAIKDICSAALIFIMFYGGFGTNWQTAKPVALEAGILATLGVMMTALITGVFCHFVLLWNWTEALLMGSVISSTDAASVFSILRSRKLGLKNGSAPLLEMESGSNDPCSYMMTIIMISVLNGESKGALDIGMQLLTQLGLGTIFGLVIATLSVMMMRRTKFATAGFDSLLIIAIAIFSYAIPDIMGGNGYLSAYIVGMVLGNVDFDNRKELVHFFDGFTGLMQVIIFFMLGLMARPSALQSCALPAAGIFLVLLLIARPISLAVLLSPFRQKDEKGRSRCKYGFKQQLLLSFCGLRGAASIVFAIMATVGMTLDNDVFNIVFCIVLLSIALQGSLIPQVAKGLGQIDENEDIMKTFSDFSEDVDMQFSRVNIKPINPWCGKKVRELNIPRDFLLCLVVKPDGDAIIPDGDTLLEDGDTVMICSHTYHGDAQINVRRHKLPKSSKWEGRTVIELKEEYSTQLLLIQRGQQEIIPHGNTVVLPGDILYFNEIIKSKPKRSKKL